MLMLEIKTVSPGRGVAWLLEGFDYFRRGTGAWIGIGIILIIVTIASSIIPLAGLFLQILFPVIMGGLITGCRFISDSGEMKINYLFAGFRENTGKLLLVGILYSAGLILITVIMLSVLFIVTGGVEFMLAIINGDTGVVIENASNLLLVSLIGLSIYLPLLMAIWFAPALIVLEGAGAVQAIKYSFIGCLKNIMPFLVYGLVSLPLSLLATVPILLGWFVLGPMIVASIYIAYKDIFIMKSVLTGSDPRQ
jgi:hypothetical protein